MGETVCAGAMALNARKFNVVKSAANGLRTNARMKKTTEEILTKAIQLKPDFVEWMRKHLDGWGDVSDQLRVLGHMCQAGVDLAQHELEEIRMQEQMEKPIVKVYN